MHCMLVLLKSSTSSIYFNCPLFYLFDNCLIGNAVLVLMNGAGYPLDGVPIKVNGDYPIDSCPFLEYNFRSLSTCQMHTAVAGCKGFSSCSGRAVIKYLS